MLVSCYCHLVPTCSDRVFRGLFVVHIDAEGYGCAPVPTVGVLCRVDGHALEAAPAHAEGEGVAVLEQLPEPAVALQAQLQEAPPLLRARQPAHQQRLRRVPVLQQLAGDACARTSRASGAPTLSAGSSGVIRQLWLFLFSVSSPAVAAPGPSAAAARKGCLCRQDLLQDFGSADAAVTPMSAASRCCNR